MKRLVSCLLILGLLLLLCGCLQGVPLDRYCYVLDVGVERGETMPYRFVFLLNDDMGGEAGEEQGGVSLISAEERSLFAAVDALSGALPAQLSFERTTLLAFSREIAEAGEMEAVMEGALSRLKIRQNVRVVVVEADMPASLQGLVSPGDPGMDRLKANVKLLEENFGYVEDQGLADVREAFGNGTGDALLPYAALLGAPLQSDMAGGQAYPYLGGRLLGEGQLKTSLCGSAVFAGDRMVGLLSGQHTMLVLMANGGFRAGHVSLDWGEDTLAFALYAVGRPQRAWKSGTFFCTIALEADLEDPARVDVDSETVIAALSRYLEEELDRVFRATAAAGADVFSVGREAITAFSSWDKWRAYAFRDRLKAAEPVFTVRVKLSHSPRDPALE